MPPEVLAWTLLFVIGFALVYRFFAWIGRLARRQPPRRESDAPAATAPAAPLQSAAVDPIVAELIVPAAAEPTVTAPAEADSVREVATDPPAPLLSASPAAPRFIAPPPMPLAASAVMSARIAGEAVRMALAPSIAATLPPRPKPSVEATLPPRTTATPPKERMREPEQVAAAPTDNIFADLARSSSIPDEVTPRKESAESAVSNEMPQPIEATRSIRLLARRIGREAVKLDIRLRDSRERRVVPMPKTLRSPTLPATDKGLKVLMPKVAPERGPSRRIGIRPGDAVVLASTPVRCRIIGASPRPSRVLAMSSV